MTIENMIEEQNQKKYKAIKKAVKGIEKRYKIELYCGYLNSIDSEDIIIHDLINDNRIYLESLTENQSSYI